MIDNTQLSQTRPPRSDMLQYSDVRRRCPICGSSRLQNLGEIVHAYPTKVAGVKLDLGDQTFFLQSCRDCGFQMKDPPLPERELIRCYESSSFDHWDESPDPYVRQFDLIRDLVTQHATGRKILDIGCFNGALLHYFGDAWQRFGVEPSEAAARVAEQRNVHILGGSLQELDDDQNDYDVVMAIDVLEHLIDPMPFLKKASACVGQGGIFLVVTGNADALTWRMQKSLYYYCRFPEHVAFYQRRTMEFIGAQLGLNYACYKEIRHKRLRFARWLNDAWKNALYLTICRTRGLGIAALNRKFRQLRGPSFFASRDHMMYLFCRDEPVNGVTRD